MFDSREYDYKSSQSLKEHFARYCNWCWYKGYGNCTVCKRLKNKTLLELKLIEYKNNI